MSMLPRIYCELNAVYKQYIMRAEAAVEAEAWAGGQAFGRNDAEHCNLDWSTQVARSHRDHRGAYTLGPVLPFGSVVLLAL